MSATISFSPSGDFNQHDLSNMLGAMLGRSMRIAKGGDPFGDSVRQQLPTFAERYNMYRQMDIDRYGSEDEVYKNTRIPNRDNANLPMERWQAEQERRWRSKAANDMLSYQKQKDNSLFGRSSWSDY